MSDVLWTRVSYAGHVREVATPKDLPDAQAVHTAAVRQALRDVHRDEADIVQGFDEQAAEELRNYEPEQQLMRHLPASAERGYYAYEVWRPALPVVRWKPPKLLKSDAAALNAGRKLNGKCHTIKARMSEGRSAEITATVTFEEV